MLFGKKKTEQPTNPYYSPEQVAQQQMNAAQSQNAPQQTAPQAAQQPSEDQGSKYPVPLLPVPESLMKDEKGLPPMSMGTPTKISPGSIDLITPKSFAFVKLSSFKQVLEDIKVLENEISQVEDDLDRFTHIVKEEEDTIRKYNSMIDGLKRTLSDLKSSLSNVEE